MAQSNTAPVLDKKVEQLHASLVAVLGGERADEKPGDPYWDTSATTLQDDFKARVDKLVKSYADQPGTDSKSATRQSGG